MSILVICAWCHKDMGKKEGDAPYPISHSICPDCEQKVRSETEEILNHNNRVSKQHERRI